MKRRFLGLFLTVALLYQTLGGIAHAQETEQSSTGVAEAAVKAEESSAEQPAAENDKMEAAGEATEEGAPGEEKDAAADVEGTAAEETAGEKENAAAEESAETKAAETEQEPEETKNEETEASVQPQAEEKADVNKPVIENVEFPQQGKTLKKGDTVELHVKAYDADSGIQEIRGTIYTDGGGISESFSFSYNESAKQWEGTVTLGAVGTGKAYISGIRVVDKWGNYADWKSQDDSGNYLYWFNTEAETGEIKITEFNFEQNGQTLDVGDVVSMTMVMDTALEEERVCARFWNSDADASNVLDLYKEWESNRYTSTLWSSFGDGTWTLTEIYVSRVGGDVKLQLDNIENYSFTMKWSEEVAEDKEPPVITSVELEQNGEILRAGDKVTVTVKATDNVGLDESSAYVYFSAAADIDDGWKTVYLTYDAEDEAYHGVFEVDADMYPCEWYISSIDIQDLAGNYASSNLYQGNYPYYVQVYNGNTFVNPQNELTVVFYMRDADGNWEEKPEQKVMVQRRQTLKEAGIVFPEMESAYPGLKQIGWESWRDSGNEITEDTQLLGDSYLTVYAKYDKELAFVTFHIRNEYGSWEAMPEQRVIAQKGQTLKEAGIEFPEMKSVYPEMKQVGWEDWSENEITEDTQLTTEFHLSVYAKYDKSRVNVNYGYVNKEGQMVWNNQYILIEPKTTYEEFMEGFKSFRPEDGTEEYDFEAWEDKNKNQDAGAVLGRDEWIQCVAKYSGKLVLSVTTSYYETNGDYCSWGTMKAAVMDEDATLEELAKLLNSRPLPEMYPGLRFKEWSVSADELENGSYVAATAVYENCLVRYLIDPRYAEEEFWGDYGCETIVCQTAEKGETVTMPKSFEGYSEVTWVVRPEGAAADTFTVTGDMVFKGYGKKVSAEPEIPTEPERPTEPEAPTEPEKPTEPERPAYPIPESKVKELVRQVEAAAEGSVIVVDMEDATVVPAKLLEAAKGKDVDIQLDMGGYTWTINGKDILASNLKDINMQVVMDTKEIPTSTIRNLAGENPVRQLSLMHEGDFGFKATLTVNMGQEYAGRYGNLFYHDSEGKMVFIDAGRVREDGSVGLTFSHASDYVIVMSTEKMAPASSGSTQTPLKKNETTGKGTAGAATGDNTNAFPWLFGSLSAFVVLALYAGKNYKRKRD
ncbi:MAG: hypothetical protein HFI67_04140 [Lachnospiraceae bacterium]|nr:hypothetical protein [Lachnospiraceae bacterium]